MSLSQKILLASGFLLLLLFMGMMGIFWIGQTRLTTQEMDRLLGKEALTFASLVNLTRRGEIDFEFTQEFLPNYEKLNRSSFFRYYRLPDQTLLRESPGSPNLACDLDKPFRTVDIGEHSYRVHSYRFQAVAELGQTIPSGTIEPFLCAVIGNDESPYRDLTFNTILFTLPFVLAIFVIALLVLQYIIKVFTADLSTLAKALEKSDFPGTRTFPELPTADTREVHAIVETLNAVHTEAMGVYKEMILFMGRAAHQLKTPLAAMQATYEVLVRKERSREELLSGLSDLHIGIKQMGRLTSRLISSTRLNFNPRPECKRINLQDFFTQLCRIYQYQAAVKAITFDKQGKGDIEVWADDSLMMEIFGNLLDNALLYSPKGSGIRMSWELGESFTLIRIQDNGPGIPKEVQDHLFEPFVRGDEREIQGSGLGLSIVQSAVQSMGGWVKVQDSTDEGTTIDVVLPFPPEFSRLHLKGEQQYPRADQ